MAQIIGDSAVFFFRAISAIRGQEFCGLKIVVKKLDAEKWWHARRRITPTL